LKNYAIACVDNSQRESLGGYNIQNIDGTIADHIKMLTNTTNANQDVTSIKPRVRDILIISFLDANTDGVQDKNQAAEWRDHCHWFNSQGRSSKWQNSLGEWSTSP
jgi:hypothetical protein